MNSLNVGQYYLLDWEGVESLFQCMAYENNVYWLQNAMRNPTEQERLASNGWDGIDEEGINNCWILKDGTEKPILRPLLA